MGLQGINMFEDSVGLMTARLPFVCHCNNLHIVGLDQQSVASKLAIPNNAKAACEL